MAYPLGQALLYGAIIALVLLLTAPLWSKFLVKAWNFFKKQLREAGDELTKKKSRRR